MNTIQAAAVFLFIASLLPLVFCLFKMQQLKKYKAKATVTTAFILRSEKKRRYKNPDYYSLDIQYLIHTGIFYKVQTTSWKKYTAGDQISLMYLNDDPANFKTDFGQSLNWLFCISIILLIGTGWLCYWLLTQVHG